jgi:class 3 adenylate cyclase/tetratricopeptide (TPR) repeat protein
MGDAALTPFVPDMVVRRSGNDTGRPGPDVWPLAGVVLTIDITGFTELTERLARRGPGGAETLADVLNDAFGDVIDQILGHGGDIVAFAGDAIQAVWPADDPELSVGVRRAAAAALDAQRALTSRRAMEGVTVQARAGIDVGAMWGNVIGGHGDEWRWVVLGPPLEGAGTAAGRAEPQQVVLTTAAASAGDLVGDPTDESGSHLVIADVVPRPEAGDSPAAVAGSEVGPSAGIDDLALLLPQEVVATVRAGHAGWLAEFRHLTAMFVGVHDFDGRRLGAPATLQTAFLAVQKVVEHYGGSLNQILDDDKATLIVAGWGLPGRTHEDDAARGALAGHAIATALAELGLQASIGLATGRCFAGVLGSPSRGSYTMFGDVMNLAARLMQSSRAEVRCDAATSRQVDQRVAVTPLGLLELKGKSTAVEAFRVDGPQVPEPPPGGAPTGIGRTAESDLLAERVGRLSSTRAGGVVVIEGEPGIGKSELISRLTQSSAAVRWHLGEADAIERSTGYYVWRRPLLGLLGVDGDERSAVEAAVRAALSDAPDLLAAAPLLNAILPIELPATGRSSGLEADVRADALRSLVVYLVSGAAREQPRALVLEDAHWMDSSSWALALEVARRVPGVLLVVSTRPMADEAPVELSRLLAEPGAIRLPLGPLGPADAEALLCQGLGVDAVPPGLAAFIEERAEGNPFFSGQLALALRDAGHLLIEGDRCRLAPDVELGALDLPDTVWGVVAGRVDGLSRSEQLTLKVASVVGRLFRYRVLADIHPVDDERDHLAAHLEHATSLDLTRVESPDPDLAYLFTHVITQEVAYGLLVFAQRRPLHRAVAEWYEANVDDRAPLIPLLAHHWGRAGVPDKALHYLGRAGEVALSNYANVEALGFLTDALALDDAEGRPTPAPVRADWERWSGIALTKAGRYRDALAHFEAALELLGVANPRGGAQRSLSIARHAGLQAWRRLRQQRLPVSERNRLLAISECHRYLCEVSYWQNDLPRWAHGTFASLNHAEPAGDSREAVVAFASVGFLLGVGRLHRVARGYFDTTAEVGDRVGSPDASGYAAELEAVYGLFAADWTAARKAAERGARIFGEVGDRMRWHTCFSLVGYADLHQGRFDEARPCWAEGLAALGPDGHPQGRLWSLAALLATDLAQGRPDPAVVDELTSMLDAEVHHSDEIFVRGLLASAHDRAGSRPAALREAQAILPMLETFPPPSWHAMLGIAGAAQVLIDDWERAGAADRAARDRAHRAIRGLRRFSRFSRAARPRIATLEGRAHWIAGHEGKARRAWRRATVAAAELDMPIEASLAAIELAASHRAGSIAREEIAGGAVSRLDSLGAAYDAARALALIGDRVSGASEGD